MSLIVHEALVAWRVEVPAPGGPAVGLLFRTDGGFAWRLESPDGGRTAVLGHGDAKDAIAWAEGVVEKTVQKVIDAGRNPTVTRVDIFATDAKEIARKLELAGAHITGFCSCSREPS